MEHSQSGSVCGCSNNILRKAAATLTIRRYLLIIFLTFGPREFQMGVVRTHAQWRICTAKNRLGHPLLFTEFKDTNDEAVWLGILFSTTQKN